MKRYQCIPLADYLSLVNATAVTPTQFTAAKISMLGAISASVTYYVEGVLAACAEKITFTFQAYDGLRDSWDTIALFTKEITMTGVTPVQETDLLDVGYEAIRLYSVANAAAGGTGRNANVNASIHINF